MIVIHYLLLGVVIFLGLQVTLEATRRGGLRAISCQAEKPHERKDARPHTTETLIGYIECCGAFFFMLSLDLFVFVLQLLLVLS